MKRVYFVRHGITASNEVNAYQKLDTPLSDNGRAQAKRLAERFSKTPFDLLVASPMERAQETARIVAEKTGHEVVSEALFQEILRPSVVRGKANADPEAMEVMRLTRTYWTIDGKHHLDEENFHDLKRRAQEALSYLTSRNEETMVVVTHGTILKIMIAVMMFGETLDPAAFDNVDEFFFPENTGISCCEYDNKYHPNRWQLISWNDHAHLG